MNKINFTGKIIADKSLYTLKHSDAKKIYDYNKKVLEQKPLQDLLGENDVLITGVGRNKGDKITIYIGGEDIDIDAKGEIKPWEVLNQVFLWICFKNGKRPRNATFPKACETILKIIQEKNAPIN